MEGKEQEQKIRMQELDSKISVLRQLVKEHRVKVFESENQANLYIDAFIDSQTPIEKLSPVQRKRCLSQFMVARQHQRMVQHHETLISSLCRELYEMNNNYEFIRWGIQRPDKHRPSTDSSLFGRHH